MTNRADAIIARYDAGALNQQWDRRRCFIGTSTVYQFRNAKSQLCLDKPRDDADANGNRVYQYTCSLIDPPLNQLWSRRSQGGSVGNWQQLVSLYSWRCLDIHNRQYANGARLVQWDCVSNDQRSWSQQWNVL